MFLTGWKIGLDSSLYPRRDCFIFRNACFVMNSDLMATSRHWQSFIFNNNDCELHQLKSFFWTKNNWFWTNFLNFYFSHSKNLHLSFPFVFFKGRLVFICSLFSMFAEYFYWTKNLKPKKKVVCICFKGW